MKVVFYALIAIGVYLMMLATYIAYKSCDPVTLLTVEPNLMKVGTIIFLVGICTTFGAVLCLDDLKRGGR